MARGQMRVFTYYALDDGTIPADAVVRLRLVQAEYLIRAGRAAAYPPRGKRRTCSIDEHIRATVRPPATQVGAFAPSTMMRCRRCQRPVTRDPRDGWVCWPCLREIYYARHARKRVAALAPPPRAPAAAWQPPAPWPRPAAKTPGRPPTFVVAAECRATLRSAIGELSRRGHALTVPRIADLLAASGDDRYAACSDRRVRQWCTTYAIDLTALAADVLSP
jgi:hypothetical protein